MQKKSKQIRDSMYSSYECDINNMIINNYYEICELLIKNGADVNACIWGNEMTTLMVAYSGNKSLEIFMEDEKDKKDIIYTKKICKLLLDNGANVNHVGRYDTTILEMAISNKDVEFCKLLIEKGADVNVKSNNGFTALMNASYEGHKEICELLIENGADVNVKNNHGLSSLMYASNKGNKEICRFLIENGADVEVCKDKISEEYYTMFQTIKKEYDDLIKGRNVSRCHFIKEDLMAYVWNPERDFTKWALMDEFSEELKPIGGAGLY